MKLSDFVFRDLHFFIDMFVDPCNTESLKKTVNGLSIYKWGISEPGYNGRIILSCSSTGEIQKSYNASGSPATWTLFFAFLPETDNYRSALEHLDYVTEIWTEGSTFFRCGGFEVKAINRPTLVELIEAASEG
jgi:hypothetical protein